MLRSRRSWKRPPERRETGFPGLHWHAEPCDPSWQEWLLGDGCGRPPHSDASSGLDPVWWTPTQRSSRCPSWNKRSRSVPPRKRRIFTPEFKAEAVRLVLDEGKSVLSVAKDL